MGASKLDFKDPQALTPKALGLPQAYVSLNPRHPSTLHPVPSEEIA